MEEYTIVNNIEHERFNQDLMLPTQKFMVEIIDDNKLVKFYPHMINSFSVNNKEIFITMYDMLNNNDIIEETLDDWSKGFWLFKKRFKVILYRLDSNNNDVYKVVYSGCKLRKYNGKNFISNAIGIHEWYIGLSFKNKKIIKNKAYFGGKQVHGVDEVKQATNERLIKNYESSVLKKSNNMLDESVKTVKSNKKINKHGDREVIEQIDKAKTENNDLVNRYYGKSLNDFDLSKMENMIKKQIADLEGEINN